MTTNHASQRCVARAWPPPIRAQVNNGRWVELVRAEVGYDALWTGSVMVNEGMISPLYEGDMLRYPLLPRSSGASFVPKPYVSRSSDVDDRLI